MPRMGIVLKDRARFGDLAETGSRVRLDMRYGLDTDTYLIGKEERRRSF